MIGSIVLDDFRVNSSDIDVLVITKKKLSKDDLSKIELLHLDLYNTSIWGKRMEVSYITEDMLRSDSGFGQKRPYFNSGRCRCEPYGQEWYIDKHILTTKGICISGNLIDDSIAKVSVIDLKCASINFFLEDLKPLIDQAEILSSEYLVFVTLSLCRILYTLKEETITSKSKSVDWTDKYTQHKYYDLLRESIDWELGKEFKRQSESIEFMTEMSNKYISL